MSVQGEVARETKATAGVAGCGAGASLRDPFSVPILGEMQSLTSARVARETEFSGGRSRRSPGELGGLLGACEGWRWGVSVPGEVAHETKAKARRPLDLVPRAAHPDSKTGARGPPAIVKSARAGYCLV